MKRLRLSFTAALVLLGCAMGGAVAFDLGFRGLHRHPDPPVWPLTAADAAAGREAIVRYGCGGCHVIPGIGQATGRVGPRLEDFVHQSYIAGVLPNTDANLIQWIQHPQRIHSDTAMPDLGVTEEEARHMAAYLYSRR